jgi:pyridoxine 4-dehydrogenase
MSGCTPYNLFNRKIGPIGLGLMGFSCIPDKKVPREQAFATLKKSIEMGANFWNAGEFYGRPDPHSNLQLIQDYFTKYPEDAPKVFLSVKGGANIHTWRPDGSPENLERSITATLKFLNGRPLDMYTLCRVDPKVPIEVSLEAIAQFVKQGKVKHICLSEVNADTLRKAHKIHPISAVEIEYSMWSQEAVANGLMEACHELGIVVISYSPLGKGLFSGSLSAKDLSENDMRRHFDRFKDENAIKNQALIDKVTAIAKAKGVTNSQVALAWIRQHSNLNTDKLHYPYIIPIPGTTNPTRVVENSTDVKLSEQEFNELETFLQTFTVSGHRYVEAMEGSLYK